MRERQKYHAIVHFGITLERSLDEVPAPATFHFVPHRENFQNERVNVAVINWLRRDVDLVEHQIFEELARHNHSFPFFFFFFWKNVSRLISLSIFFLFFLFHFKTSREFKTHVES